MTLLQGILLSIVQAVSEFLPISSKGHLNLAQHLLGMEPSLTFDIFLNTATLLSVIFFFRSQIGFFIKNLRYIIVGTIPAVVMGYFFKETLEPLYSRVELLPYFFLITAAFLIASVKFDKKNENLTYKKALIIGLFQSLALLPGISRSGSTILSGLLVGLSPVNAFNFSFSLFIPASFGALLLDYQNILNMGAMSTPYLVSFVVAFIVGIISLSLLKRILVGNKLWVFGVYLVVLSALCLFLL